MYVCMYVCMYLCIVCVCVCVERETKIMLNYRPNGGK
jgi:hypothetical protein